MTIETIWHGVFTNEEVNRLKAEAFETRVFDETEWNWEHLVRKHSLGWATGRWTSELVGFVRCCGMASLMPGFRMRLRQRQLAVTA